GLLGQSIPTTETIISINSISSSFGAGWGLAGLKEIVLNDDGSALLVDGDGSEEQFFPPDVPGNSWVAATGDPSQLTQDPGSHLFKRVMEDGSVQRFNNLSKLDTVTHRNG